MSGTIVVGVDGSPSSGAALRWAASEAALRSARLIALHTWSYIPLAAVGDPGMIAMPSADLPGQLEAEQTAAQVELDSALAEAFPDGTPAGLEARLAEGDAGETLVAESADADLVVVGSRGRGGLAATLLGSVSGHVLHNAQCAVVVVKAPKD